EGGSTAAPFNKSERALVVKLGEYNDVVARATEELMPHYICHYLYETAQEFNRFYENTRVIGSENETELVHLVSTYAATLKSGLGLLGIDAPETM
ncbi:arginine--tRNA ligase, partial [Microbacteriaceae bacterium]|nr:arginine--tRNA ligase [Candidatus Saccharibacteria bacterium]